MNSRLVLVFIDKKREGIDDVGCQTESNHAMGSGVRFVPAGAHCARSGYHSGQNSTVIGTVKREVERNNGNLFDQSD